MFQPVTGSIIRRARPGLTPGPSRAFSTSGTVDSRRWKYLLRPDLKGENHPKALLNKYNLAIPEERTEYNKFLFNNHLYWWRPVDPDEICRRLNNVLATDFKRPNGGISLNIVRVLLQLAKTPQHLQVAMQCVTVWQHNQPAHEKKQQLERKVPGDVGKLICNAAARVSAPEIGISWLQMPWINCYRSLEAHNVLLEYYAKEAETHFLLRRAEGMVATVPESYKDRLPKDEKQKDEDEDEEEEEEEGAEGAKKEKKRFKNWLANYMILLKELRAEKHTWSPNSESFALITRFYAALGDTKQALDLFEKQHDADAAPAWDRAIANLTLALAHQGQTEKAAEVLRKASVQPLDSKAGAFALRRAYIGVLIASRDEAGIKSVLDKFSATRKEMFGCHFGDPDNVEFLLRCLESVPEQAQKAKYFMNLVRALYLKKEEATEVNEETGEAEEEEEGGAEKE